MVLLRPNVRIAEEDGSLDLVYQSPGKEAEWVKVKLRNKSNRLIVFRVRFEGSDVNSQFAVLPIDVGILSPFDTQPFDVAAKVGVNPNFKNRAFTIETAFVLETKNNSNETTTNQAAPAQKANVLDAVEIWKSIGNEQRTKTIIPIRFEQSVNATDERHNVYLDVIDPSETAWVMNLRAWEVYGYARSKNPQETATLMTFVGYWALFWVVVGFLVGLKL